MTVSFPTHAVLLLCFQSFNQLHICVTNSIGNIATSYLYLIVQLYCVVEFFPQCHLLRLRKYHT